MPTTKPSMHPTIFYTLIKKVPVNYAAMPHAIFSSPQVAGVGFTEQELNKGVSNIKSLSIPT
jgi:pyruvate/2-oxoglutarate dehydrogenase complex dihydrolipoamide dehydrogenase (E3) component